MKKEKYLKITFGIVFTLLIIGIGVLFLFLNRQNFKKEGLFQDLLNNKYASFFNQVADDWKTYRNEKYGFEFRYPAEFLGGKARATELKIDYNIDEKGEIFNYRIDYIDENGEISDYGFDIRIFQKDLTVEFLNRHFLESAQDSIEGWEIEYWGEEIKKRDLGEKFWNQRIIYFDNQTFGYEILFPIRAPSLFGALEKIVFIPLKERNLTFVISKFFFEPNPDLLPNVNYYEEYLKMVVFEKIISTFRFLK